MRDDKGHIEYILFTITDETALELVKEENEVNRSLLATLGQRDSFARFSVDSKELIAEAKANISENGHRGRLRIILHTIKGNSAVFGIYSLVKLVHEIEEKVTASHEDIDSIELELRSYLKRHSAVLKIAYQEDCNDQYDVAGHQLELLGAALKTEKPISGIRIDILKWIYEVKKSQRGMSSALLKI